MQNKILVIIVTYNAMRWADRCFGSLEKSSVPVDTFVVDNGSTDGTREYVPKKFKCVKFVCSKENLGFGAANNIGLQYALDHGYDYVYLLNQDAWLMPDTLEKLIAVSQRHPEYGILSPMQMQANMQHLDNNFRRFTLTPEMVPYFAEDMFFECRQEIYEVPCVMAAHWLITRQCLQTVGGFSPSYHHYGEDDNYSRRVRYHGMKPGIVPAATAVHDRETRKDSHDKEMFLYAMQFLNVLSDPGLNVRHHYLSTLRRMESECLGNRSLRPLHYYLPFLRKMTSIKRNWALSQGQCAFLNASKKKTT